MSKVIRFPSVEERGVRDAHLRESAAQPARTHSGRVLEAKVLGLAQAGKRQRPRFLTPTRG